MGRVAALWLMVGLWAAGLWLGIPWRAHMIEQDLHRRSAAALNAAGLPAAGLSVDGRDVVLAGVKGSPQTSDTAQELLAGVRGVRAVRVQWMPEPVAVTPPRVPVEEKLTAVLGARPVWFTGWGAVLTESGRRTLDEIATLLMQAPALAVSIEAGGRTADVGRRRALSVRQYLIGRGLVASRLSVRGHAPGDGVEFRFKEVR